MKYVLALLFLAAPALATDVRVVNSTMNPVNITGTLSGVQVVNSTIAVVNHSGQNLNVSVANSPTVTVSGLYSGTTVYLVNNATVTVSNLYTGTTVYVVNPSTVTFNGVAQPVLVSGLNSVTTTYVVNITTVSPPAITKGTQGSTGFTVQDLHDAGRTQVNYYVTASTVGATGVESALTFTKASGTSATSSAYTFAITNGKTYRITSISVATRGNATATAQTTTFNFRLNTASNCSAASTPVIWAARSATPATASAWDRYFVDFGEGFEITGTATLQICASVNSTFVTNAPTADMIITGYEY